MSIDFSQCCLCLISSLSNNVQHSVSIFFLRCAKLQICIFHSPNKNNVKHKSKNNIFILQSIHPCCIVLLFAGDKNEDGVTKTVSDYEKAVLRNEFIEIMKQRFLDGKDSEFNYR